MKNKYSASKSKSKSNRNPGKFKLVFWCSLWSYFIKTDITQRTEDNFYKTYTH